MSDLDILRQNVEDLVCDPPVRGTMEYAQMVLINALEAGLTKTREVLDFYAAGRMELEIELKALKNTPCWRTDDGYRFYWVDGQWVDNASLFHSEAIDMTAGFDSRCPRDSQWNPLSGGLEGEGND